MDINSSAIAAQTAQARQNASLGFVKDNASSEAKISQALTESAETGASLASSGKGSIIDITV